MWSLETIKRLNKGDGPDKATQSVYELPLPDPGLSKETKKKLKAGRVVVPKK